MLHGPQLCAAQQELISSIQAGDFTQALNVLKKNPSIDVNFKVQINDDKHPYVTTPLIGACEFAAKDLVIALLARGAKPQWHDHSRQTALHAAVVGQDIKILDGREVDKDPIEALEDRFTVIRALCATHPEILKTPDFFGNTPLHLVALQGKVIVGNWLLIMDPTLINIKNKNQETPAQILSRRNSNNDDISNLKPALTVPPLTMLCQRQIAKQPQLRQLVLKLPDDITEKAMYYHPQGITKKSGMMY